MGVPRGGNAHFKESVYELHKRESHGFSPSVSHRLDHEVSLQGAGRRVAGADTNDYPAAVQRTWRPDRLRRFVARTCPYVRGNPAAYCGQRLRAARQGTLIASGADGVPRLAQALLGAAFLGSGLLLHHQRQHHGRCHTSVSSEARTYRRQPVVIQLSIVPRRRAPTPWRNSPKATSLSRLPATTPNFSTAALASVAPGATRDAHARDVMQLYAALGLSRTFTTGLAPELMGVPLHYLGEHTNARRYIERMLNRHAVPANQAPNRWRRASFLLRCSGCRDFRIRRCAPPKQR